MVPQEGVIVPRHPQDPLWVVPQGVQVVIPLLKDPHRPLIWGVAVVPLLEADHPCDLHHPECMGDPLDRLLEGMDPLDL